MAKTRCSRLSVVWCVGVLLALSGCQAPGGKGRLDRDNAKAARAVSATAQSDLVVCSWNIKWFGRSEPSKYDLTAIADFAQTCDVLAVQEVTGRYYEECLDAVIAKLAERGLSYRYECSEETGYDENPDPNKHNYLERFAFLWNADSVDLTDTAGLVSDPAINHSVFRQVPFVADFAVTGGRGFDFRVMTVHTTYNKDINYVRRDEISFIRDWVVAESHGDEQNIIAIGDFNANPPSQSQGHFFAEIIPDESDFRVLMYESAAAGETPVRTTVPTKDSSADPDYFIEPVYDHILVSHPTSYALPGDPMTRRDGHMGVAEFDNDSRWMELGLTRRQIIRAVSDHRPVWFKLDYHAEDLD